MSKSELSTFNGVRVINTGYYFRVERHQIIGDTAFKIKHFNINMDEAIRLKKELQESILKQKKVDTLASSGKSLKSGRKKNA